MKKQENLLRELEENRKACGLNVIDFSKKIGICKDTYYHWLKGKAPATLNIYLKAEEYLNEYKRAKSIHKEIRNLPEDAHAILHDYQVAYLVKLYESDPELAKIASLSMIEALFTGKISINNEQIFTVLKKLNIPFELKNIED